MELPKELDDFLFKELGAGPYIPREQRREHSVIDIEHTENLEGEGHKYYLANYFPESFVAGYEIMNALLKCEIIKENLKKDDKINILDIGAGRGDYLTGLLWALKDCHEIDLQSKSIKIFPIDSNFSALEDYLEKTIKRFFQGYCEVFPCQKKIDPNNFFNDIEDIVLNTGIQRFNIISTSKFLREFFRNEYDRDILKGLLNFVYRYLEKKGLSFVNEVTDKVILPGVHRAGLYGMAVTDKDDANRKNYLPVLMNRDVIEFLHYNRSIKCIIPLSCALWYDRCQYTQNPSSECFTNRVYQVSHSMASNYNFKVNYKVFTLPEYADEILEHIRDNYQIEKNNSQIVFKIATLRNRTNYCKQGSCIRGYSSYENEKVFDAFLLNQNS